MSTTSGAASPPAREEYPLQLPKGRFWHDITLAPLLDSQGRVMALVGFIRDITDRKQAEQLLSESEERYRAVVEQIADAIVIHADGLILFANRAAHRILGIEDPSAMLGKSVLDFFHPDSRAAAAQRLERIAQGETRLPQMQERFVAPDGRVFHGEVRSQAITFDGRRAQLAIIRDLTEQHTIAQEREQMRARMAQSQKFESLGLLASGVAHDFNNLLLGVLGNAGLALPHLPEGSPAADHLEKIETAAIRASQLTRQLLTYAGSEEPVLEPVDLAELVDEMTGLLTVSLPAGIRLERQFHPGLVPVRADSAQLRQVVMNLILNAADAMHHEGGRIRIRASRIEPDRNVPTDADPPNEAPTDHGAYVRLVVEDDGCGMDEQTIERIFDPFFTTKATGRGLGLAAVQGIVRTHRGTIQVRSEPHRGSTFEIHLPAAG